MKIKTKIKPNSPKQEIKKEKEIYVIKLKSPPEKNKANKELINLISKFFKAKSVRIVRGLKSKMKTIEVE